MQPQLQNMSYGSYYPQQNPNAVNINIFTPTAYGTNSINQNLAQNSNYPANLPEKRFYSVYGENNMPNLPLYPANYNTPISNLYGMRPQYANNLDQIYPIQQGYNLNTPQINPINGYNPQLANSMQPYYTPQIGAQNAYGAINPAQIYGAQMYPAQQIGYINPAQLNGYSANPIQGINGYNPQFINPAQMYNQQAGLQNLPQQSSNGLQNQMQNLDKNSQTSENINKNINQNETNETKKSDEKKEKSIVPLTDEYIKNLENYLNSNNPKVRVIAIKEIMQRFKEDENRYDNPSLIALLNKALKDKSPTVRFLALTTLQLGYSIGNEETANLLNKIANENQDKFGQDAILASEALLKLSAPRPVKIKEGGE